MRHEKPFKFKKKSFSFSLKWKLFALKLGSLSSFLLLKWDTLVDTRKYPLRGYILGVLTHTTTLDSLRGGNNTLKWIYSAWLYLAKYCNVWSSASPHLMGPGGLRVSQTTHFSLLTHAKQLSSVTFCDTTAGRRKKWKCDGRTDVRTEGRTEGQTDMKFEIDI